VPLPPDSLPKPTLLQSLPAAPREHHSDKGEGKETTNIQRCYKLPHTLPASGPEGLREKPSHPQHPSAPRLVGKSTEHVTGPSTLFKWHNSCPLQIAGGPAVSSLLEATSIWQSHPQLLGPQHHPFHTPFESEGTGNSLNPYPPVSLQTGFSFPSLYLSQSTPTLHCQHPNHEARCLSGTQASQAKNHPNPLPPQFFYPWFSSCRGEKKKIIIENHNHIIFME